MAEREPARDGPLLDLVRGHHRADRETPAEVLRHGDDVRDDPLLLVAVHRPELAETGLRLVEDEEGPPRMDLLREGRQVPGRHLDDPARADERLDDDPGEVPRAFAIQKLEAHVEDWAPPLGVLVGQGRTVRIGSGNGVDVRNGRPVARPRGAIAHRPRHVGVAVKAQVKGRDPASPGATPRKQHGRLVRVRPRLDEEHALQGRIEGPGELPRQLDLGHVVVDRARVGEGAQARPEWRA